MGSIPVENPGIVHAGTVPRHVETLLGVARYDSVMTSPLDRFFRVRDHLTEDVLGGPRVRVALMINLQKGGRLPSKMLCKDARMARHPGWSAYRARTGLLFPRVAIASIAREDVR